MPWCSQCLLAREEMQAREEDQAREEHHRRQARSRPARSPTRSSPARSPTRSRHRSPARRRQARSPARRRKQVSNCWTWGLCPEDGTGSVRPWTPRRSPGSSSSPRREERSSEEGRPPTPSTTAAGGPQTQTEKEKQDEKPPSEKCMRPGGAQEAAWSAAGKGSPSTSSAGLAMSPGSGGWQWGGGQPWAGDDQSWWESGWTTARDFRAWSWKYLGWNSSCFDCFLFKVVVHFLGGGNPHLHVYPLRQPEELDNFREAPMSFWEEMQEKESDLDWIMIKCTLVCI